MEIDGEEESSESRINFVSCIKWVRKGVANPNPPKVQLSKDELVKIIKDAKEKLSISTSQTENGQPQAENGQPQAENEQPAPVFLDGDEFGLENYDNDNDSNTANLLGIQNLAELPTQAEDNFSDSDDSEKEDDVIKPADNLILVGHVDGDASMLEVYAYNEEEPSLYVHHDILLPSFPLCLEWLNYEPNMPHGNYCAIGSMNPVIEVWDMDIINCIEPAFTLGRAPSKKKKRRRVGHEDAVLALAWNQNYDHILASGSVDKTVMLWDMEHKIPSTTITAFGDKVQCLQWHKLEAQTLLAGGCDCTARVFDCRTPEPHQVWNLDGEVEQLVWNPLQPFMFIAGTNNGLLQCFDCRKGKLWSLEAHSKEVTGLSISGQCPGLMVSASPDGSVKTWDLAEEGVPKLVNDRDFSIGIVHALDLCPDLPFVIAAGGDNKSNNFCVYDLQNIDPVRQTFESRPLRTETNEGGNVSST